MDTNGRENKETTADGRGFTQIGTPWSEAALARPTAVGTVGLGSENRPTGP